MSHFAIMRIYIIDKVLLFITNTFKLIYKMINHLMYIEPLNFMLVKNKEKNNKKQERNFSQGVP
jgi:hypothetical protein